MNWLRRLNDLMMVAAITIVVWVGNGGLLAQTTSITPSGLNTRVANPTTNPNITGGTRPGGAAGTNLFHSFGELNIGTNNVASFLNSGSVDLAGNALPSGLATSNIFSRVTGGNPSNIFGTIDTMNFGSANLYLVNPAGILFGPTASLNVGGSFTATTADYLKMTDGAKFYANPSQPTVLSIAPVAAFGFLGTNPGGTITIQGSFLRTGDALSFVGRDLTVNNTTTPGIAVTGTAFLAPFPSAGGLALISVGQVAEPVTGGEVNIAPATATAEVPFPSFPLTYSLSGFGKGGTVVVDTLIPDHFMVLTPPSGNVRINFASTNGNRTPIAINTGTLEIDGLLAAGGAVQSGPIDLTAASSVTLNGFISSQNHEFFGVPTTITSPSVFLAPNSGISTENGGFVGGNIVFNIGSLHISSGAIISSSSVGGKRAGDIVIQGLGGEGTSATSVNIGGSITSETDNFGTGGKITISSKDINLFSGALVSSAELSPSQGFIFEGTGAGNIILTASRVFQSTGGAVTSTSVDSEGGDVTLVAGGISLTNGALLSASSMGLGKAGNVQVTSGGDITLRNSVIQTSAAQASGGNIKLTAPNLVRIVDSTITSSVQGEAATSNGGNISIDPQVVVIQNSNLLANANAGAGGNINISALGAVLVDPNSLIDASAGPAGISGSVNINSPIQVLSGALVPMKLAYTQTGLSGDRCAADPKGQFSSFVQTGRDGAPQTPGGLGSSPLGFLDAFQTSFLDVDRTVIQSARIGLSEILGQTSNSIRFISGCRSEDS